LGYLRLVQADGLDHVDYVDGGDDDGVGFEVHGEDHIVKEFVFVVVGVVGLGGGELFLFVELFFAVYEVAAGLFALFVAFDHGQFFCHV